MPNDHGKNRKRRHGQADTPLGYTGGEQHEAYGGYGDLDPARYGRRENETHRDRFGGGMSVREAGDHGDIYDEPRRGGWSGASRGEPEYGAGYGASGFNRPDRWGWLGPGQGRPHESDWAAPGPHRGRGPRGYRRSDARILEDVNDRLTEDAHLDATNIEVNVTGGEVTLSGTVDSRGARRHAEDIAENVSGVTYVQNNLRVATPGGER